MSVLQKTTHQTCYSSDTMEHHYCQTSHGTETPQRWNKHFRTVTCFISSSRQLPSDLAPFLGGGGLFLAKQKNFPPLTHHHKSSIKHDMQTLRQIVRRGGRIIPCVYSLFTVLMSCFLGVWVFFFFANVAPHLSSEQTLPFHFQDFNISRVRALQWHAKLTLPQQHTASRTVATPHRDDHTTPGSSVYITSGSLRF